MIMKINESWLSICNNALSRINVSMLESLDEPQTSAILCKQLLPICIGEVFNVRPWKSATKRYASTALKVAPEYGYKYQFLLPEDFVRIVSIDNMENDEWIREGRFILAEKSILQMRYIAIPDGADSISPLLLSAITSRLASKLAPSLLGDTHIGQVLLQESIASIQLAITEEDAGIKDEMYSTHDWRL